QLLLGVVGLTRRNAATIGDIADFLQVRHHSAVGLVDRAEAAGLVRREVNPDDQRIVYVSLTPVGHRKLRQLTDGHRKELSGLRRSLNIFRLEEDNATTAKQERRQKGARRG